MAFAQTRPWTLEVWGFSPILGFEGPVEPFKRLQCSTTRTLLAAFPPAVTARSCLSSIHPRPWQDHQLWVFSGCQDDQTSADAHVEGIYQGAFTWALLKALSLGLRSDERGESIGVRVIRS